MNVCERVTKSKSNPLYYAFTNNYEEIKVIHENPDFQNLLEQCFTYNHNDRPSAIDLISHPFFQ